MKYTATLVQQLADALQQKLSGFAFHEAFSSGRNELFLHFHKDGQTFAMRMSWAARSCFLFFRDEAFDKPVPHQLQFRAAEGKRILSVRAHRFNRSLQIALEGGLILVFKLYNGLSNVLLYERSTLLSHFRTSIESDLQQQLAELDKQEAFTAEPHELEQAGDLFEAFSQYSRHALSRHAFDTLQQSLLQQARAELKRCEQLIHKTKRAIQALHDAVPLEEIGHIIMANLHALGAGQTQAELYDFYRNRNITVALKKDLDAQQNAAWYYRKAKSRQAEEALLQDQLLNAEAQLPVLHEKLARIGQAEQLKALKALTLAKQETGEPKQSLFKTFECDGYTIWVGKSAANNDLLTMKHARKDDLWLHAKDAAGSHVVVKQQPGRPFPKQVIACAASLAAYYSKLKGSALVPVAYTLRKYVRKPKGAEPGAVIVDKEEVVLAAPKLPA